MTDIPIIYIYLYHKIKDKLRGPLVRTLTLKQVIQKIIICKKGIDGGNRKGIPHDYIYAIIDDLEKLELIKKIDHTKYEVLKNNCEKKLRKDLWT